MNPLRGFQSTASFPPIETVIIQWLSLSLTGDIAAFYFFLQQDVKTWYFCNLIAILFELNWNLSTALWSERRRRSEFSGLAQRTRDDENKPNGCFLLGRGELSFLSHCGLRKKKPNSCLTSCSKTVVCSAEQLQPKQEERAEWTAAWQRTLIKQHAFSHSQQQRGICFLMLFIPWEVQQAVQPTHHHKGRLFL